MARGPAGRGRTLVLWRGLTLPPPRPPPRPSARCRDAARRSTFLRVLRGGEGGVLLPGLPVQAPEHKSEILGSSRAPLP